MPSVYLGICRLELGGGQRSGETQQSFPTILETDVVCCIGFVDLQTYLSPTKTTKTDRQAALVRPKVSRAIHRSLQRPCGSTSRPGRPRRRGPSTELIHMLHQADREIPTLRAITPLRPSKTPRESPPFSTDHPARSATTPTTREEWESRPPACQDITGGTGHNGFHARAVESAESHCLAYLSRLFRPP